MYCPKCSQQQPEGMRFCSRCGFTLSNVALLLENEGAIPPPVPERVRISRNRIIAESALLTALAWSVALIAMFWFDAGGPFEGVAKGTTLIFAILGLISLVRFLYGFLMLTETRQSSKVVQQAAVPDSLRSAPVTAVLPPQTSPTLSDYPLRVDTKEMLSRPSVTENTTRLLDDQVNSNLVDSSTGRNLKIEL